MPVFEFERDQLLTEEATAHLLQLSRKTLKNWRGLGKGPPFKKFSNRAIRYQYGYVMDWAESKTRRSTSDLGILHNL